MARGVFLFATILLLAGEHPTLAESRYVDIILDMNIPRSSSKSTVYDTANAAEQNCEDGIVRIYEWAGDQPKSWVCDDIDPATAVARELFGKDIGRVVLEESRKQYEQTIDRAYGVGAGATVNPFSGKPTQQETQVLNPFAKGDVPPAAVSDGATCTAERLPDTNTLCIGTNERCRCLVVANGCPYPVIVQWHLTNSQRKKPWRNSTDPGKNGQFCGTRDGTQEPLYLGWYPENGYPKPGQPQPRY